MRKKISPSCLTAAGIIRIIRYSCVILLIVFAGCQGPSQTTPNQPNRPLFTEVKSKGLYVHSPTGMEFPAEVAEFRRTKILEYNGAGSNISVGYELRNLGFEIAQAKVYIYPADTSLEKHYDQTRTLLFTIYTDAHDLEDGEIRIGQPFGPQRGLMFKFKYNPPELFKSRLCFGRCYLFKHGEWFIKYRLTNPVKDDEKAVNEFGTFMHTLKWPELPGTGSSRFVNPSTAQ